MTHLPNTLSGHYMAYLYDQFGDLPAEAAISRRDLRQATKAYIETYGDDQTIPTTARDKVNLLRNLKTGELKRALASFDGDTRQLTTLDVFAGHLYAQNYAQTLAEMGLTPENDMPAVAANVVAKPTQDGGTESLGLLRAPSQDQLQALMRPEPLDPTAEIGTFTIRPGARPEKLTIYFYSDPAERIIDARHQFGDEIDSGQIFITSGFNPETVDAALTAYREQTFGDPDARLSNITFESHGKGLMLMAGAEDEAGISLYQMMDILGQASEFQDYTGCETLPDWFNEHGWSADDDCNALTELVSFVDERNYDVTLNSTPSLMSWDPDADDQGAGGMAYIIDANGQVLALPRGDDQYTKDLYAEDIRDLVGQQIYDLWQAHGGLIATTDQDEDAQKVVLPLTLEDMYTLSSRATAMTAGE